MNMKLVRTMALVGALGVAACGEDDGPVATGDALSEAEAAALSEIVLGTAFQATAGIPTSPAPVNGPQAVPFSYSADIDATAPCSAGGTASLTGSATINGDDETGEFSIAYSVTAAYNECGEYAGSQEALFTVGGSLTMTATADYAQGQGQQFGTLTSTGSFTGNVSWSSDDGRSGTCAVNLTSSTTSDGQAINATTEGSFCGVSISETFTYGVPVT